MKEKIGVKKIFKIRTAEWEGSKEKKKNNVMLFNVMISTLKGLEENISNASDFDKTSLWNGYFLLHT